MDLKKLIHKENLLVLRSVTKEKALKELYQNLCDKNKLKFSNEIYKKILTREKEFPTGFGKGIAIPHLKLKNFKNIILHVGISKKGIQFDSIDGIPVKIIFLIFAGTKDEKNYLYLVRDLIQFVNKENLIVQNLNFNSKAMFLEHLNSFEEKETKKYQRTDELSKIIRLEEIRTEIKSLKKETKVDFSKKSGKTISELITNLTKEEEKICKKIQPALLDSVERISKRYNGNYMVKIFNEACSYCFNDVPTADLVKIKKGEIVRCTSCGKILYIDE